VGSGPPSPAPGRQHPGAGRGRSRVAPPCPGPRRVGAGPSSGRVSCG
jgi:hypothetical protein